MELITAAQRDQLLKNGAEANRARERDGNTPHHWPVIKLFCPWGAPTWLITEMDPEEPDILFGLCDLGFQCPELGSLSLTELIGIEGPGGLRIERDIHFRPSMSLRDYTEEARAVGAIRTC